MSSVDTVRMWMSSPAITAPHTLTLPEAYMLMQQRHIRRLPVVDSNGHVVGIVTESDMYRISGSPGTDMREYNLYYRIRDLPLHEIMSRPVFTIGADTSIMAVVQLMLEYKISGVPVVEDAKVIGMITESDLFRLIMQQQLDQAWGLVQA
jgi:CBS domain-containing protein